MLSVLFRQKYQASIFLGLAMLLKVLLTFLLVNPAYELHRDEFLYLDQGNHLAWGYTSVPPLTSWFSWFILQFGNSTFFLRLLPALFGAFSIYYAWRIAALLGANLRQKLLLVLACFCSVLLRLNVLYQPNAFDILAWTAMFYFLLKFFIRNDIRSIYAAAVWFALGFLNKYSIVLLLLALIIALLISPKRKLFLYKHVYYAALVAFVLILPNIWWQYKHQFPVFSHFKELKDTQLIHRAPLAFFKGQLLNFIPDIFILMAACAGFFARSFRRHRWVLSSFIICLILFALLQGKAYYVAGLYPVMLAFGSMHIWKLLRPMLLLRFAHLGYMLLSFILLLPFYMPWYAPAEIQDRKRIFERFGLLRWEDGKQYNLPQDFADMLAWKEIAHLVDRAYAQTDKQDVFLLCDNYGQAGAINLYSPQKGLKANTFNADYLYWMDLEKPIKDIILVKDAGDKDPERKQEQPYFKEIIRIGEVSNPNAREYGTAVYLLKAAKIDVREVLKAERTEKLKK